MDLQLSDVVVLVTGGSKGIGLACAEAFVAEGARVAIASRSRENIDKALARLPGIYGATADLADARSAAAMIDEVESALGPIGVLGEFRRRRAAHAAGRTHPGRPGARRWTRSSSPTSMRSIR